MSTTLAIPCTAQRNQIITLHNEVTGLARTSLEKAQQIGELLVQVRDSLDHGQWLPWVKENLPFTDRTARNYIRLHENRDQLKLENVSDLAGAYRLLTEGSPEPFDEEAFEAQWNHDMTLLKALGTRLDSPELTIEEAKAIKDFATERQHDWEGVTLDCERELGRRLLRIAKLEAVA